MLSQSLSLSILAASPAALAVAILSGDIGLAFRVAGLFAAAALAFGAVCQLDVTRAVKQGKVEKAKYRPLPLVIDQNPAINQPEPAPQPAKPVESVRLVPVYRNQGTVLASDGRPLFPTNRLVDGVPEIDLAYFLDHLVERGGHTRSRWNGVLFPSGRRCNSEYYEQVVAPLVKAKVITGRAPRVAGTVACSPQTAKERLGLAP